MTSIDPDDLTPSQVNRAGKTIRYFLRDDPRADFQRFAEAYDVLAAFRSAHQRPMTTANTGLRSMIRTAGCSGATVSQRLKRMPTILDKLRREPTLALAKMQDLGGCRAVFATIDDVYRVQGRLERTGRVEKVDDYIKSARDSGYRGVHVVVRYQGRRVEVQLRTQIMHQWAVTVERLATALGRDVKSGSGPEEVQNLMRAISRAMAIEEMGGTVDDSLLAEVRAAHELAAPHLRGGQR